MPAEAEWAALSKQLGADPRWQALPSDEVRRACGSAPHAPRMREGSCMPSPSMLQSAFPKRAMGCQGPCLDIPPFRVTCTA